MDSRILKILFLLICGGLYWQFVCQTDESIEPWDTEAYWSLWYPLSLALSAIAGFFFGKDGWLAGATMTFAQLPVILFNIDGLGPFIILGFFILCILALPAAAISLLTGRFGASVCGR